MSILINQLIIFCENFRGKKVNLKYIEIGNGLCETGFRVYGRIADVLRTYYERITIKEKKEKKKIKIKKRKKEKNETFNPKFSWMVLSY